MATTNNKGLIAAGYRVAYYGVVDTDGYFIGGDGTAPSAGDADGKPMRRLLGATTAPVQLTEPDSVPIPGDNTTLGQFQFPSSDLPAVVIEFSVRDLVFEAIASGAVVEILDTDAYAIENQPDFNPAPLTILLSRRAQQYSSAGKGQARWESLLLHNVIATPLGSNYEIKAPAVYGYRISLSKTDRRVTGQTLTKTYMGTKNTVGTTFMTENPMHMVSYTGNNVLTTFNLPFTPISTSKTKVFVNGVGVTVSSVSVANKTFTLASAPAANAKVIVLYQHEASEIE